MFDFLRNNYNITYSSLLKISDKTYKILTDKGYFLLKEVNDISLDSLYRRLMISKVDYILFPLRDKNDNFVVSENEKFYILLPFVSDEKIIAYDIKTNMYIHFLSDLHKKTSIDISINNSYFESTLNYLDDQIKKVSDMISSRMEVIERSDYHSPNDWYFLMHFYLFNSALEKASKHVLNFENDVREASSLRLCLTYQNFDFNHILIKDEKIISLEKMGYNISSADLYDFITKSKNSTMSIKSSIKEYFNINPLSEYEKEYLMALLYTFNYFRYENMLDDLNYLISLTEYLNIVNEIEEEIIFSSPE